MSDGEQSHEPMRRPRGRHAVPKVGPVPAGGWRARLTAVAAPVVASVEPRISAAGAWLFERRTHVLIVTASVATIAMIGGAVALISFAGAPPTGDEVATVVDTDRPTATDPAAPSSYAPILPSPAPTPSTSPTSPAPAPDDEPATPVTEAPIVPPAEPEVTEPPRPDSPPGATNRPDKPKDADKPEDCDDQDDVLLGLLIGPPCP